MLNIFLSLALVGMCVVHADVVPVSDFEGADEDRILNELKSGKSSGDLDHRFVIFVTDTDSRLTLPQTYDSAISDFVRIIGNDYKWLENSTLRKAITGLCRKITYSCNVDSSHIQEMYVMLSHVAEKFPMNERYRLLGFMNRLDGLRQKQEDSLEKVQQKAVLDAAKDAEKQKTEQEKLAAKQAVEAARAEVSQEKAAKTPRARTTRPAKSASTKESTDASSATLPDDQKNIAPAKPRGRPRKTATLAAPASAEPELSPVSVESTGHPDRFVRMPEVVAPAPADQGLSSDTGDHAETTP